jgi:NDP-sugar pyrophosphorylase family protein
VKAIILAGGKGTRLKPFTSVIPKPLVPVGDRTVLEILICRLHEQQITDLVLCVNHMSALIKAYFGTGARWGVNIEYSEETGFLGTVAHQAGEGTAGRLPGDERGPADRP